MERDFVVLVYDMKLRGDTRRARVTSAADVDGSGIRVQVKYVATQCDNM